MSLVSRIESDKSEDLLPIGALHAAFHAQRKAYLRAPFPSYDDRIKHMKAVAAMVLSHRKEMAGALHEDFGNHPAAPGQLIEVLGIVSRVEYNSRHLADWMKVETRELDPQVWGNATATVRPQPKGVIGNMVPWNFPFDISFGPLIDMLAAGNRVVLKPSDMTPACGELMARMIRDSFAADHVTTVVGGIELAKVFPTLPWNHLIYTGSPAVGKIVMRAAAENLVPVTLELGGKSPVIFTADGIDERSIGSLLGMKRLKSGQVCTSPDHVFVPRSVLAKFIEMSKAIFTTLTPSYSSSPDNTGIINARHRDRLLRMVAEARNAGCEVIVLGEDGRNAAPTSRQLPIYLIVEPRMEMAVLTEEIFGPILPIIPYDDLESVIEQINVGERPLSFSIYSHDKRVVEDILSRTSSGGACVNTALLNGAVISLPFGGVGNSGMGRHHAVEGFREFSNPRSVLTRGDAPDLLDAFNPPYRTLEAIVAGAFEQIDGSANN
jgi:coniferyl-aldehyde dehydrogenase